MANKFNDGGDMPTPTSLGITADQFKDIMTQVIAAARAPVIDPAREKHNQRAIERFRAQEKAHAEKQARKRAGCSHMRQNGTSTFAWYHIRRVNLDVGVCQRCHFYVDSVDQKNYQRYRYIPTGEVMM